MINEFFVDIFISFAVDDVEEVMLYYTMAGLSFENIVDQHIEGCIEVDKVCDRLQFGNGFENIVDQHIQECIEVEITLTL